MSCRCKDIRKCNRDLSVLYSVLRQIEAVCRSHEDLESEQGVIQNWEVQAYELDHHVRESVRQTLLRKEENTRQNMEGNQRKVDQLISRLESQLRRMEREDDRHHDDD